MKPNIGIGDESRVQIVETLNTLLATEHVLYVKTRNYHWNVVGPEFHSLHEMFEDQYTRLAETIDEIAERGRVLGGKALGTMAEFIQNSKIAEEAPRTYPPAHDMVANTIEGHEAIVRYLREQIPVIDEDCGDVGTADFLTGVLEMHEKDAWMLRSLLEGKAVNE